MQRIAKSSPEDALLRLLEVNSEWLAEYPWEWEGDRWVELLICILDSALDTEPLVVRRALDLLNETDMLDIAALLDGNAEHFGFIRLMLVRFGFTTQDAERSVELIRGAATLVDREWKGHVQRLLRKHGETMREELSIALTTIGLSKAAANKSAVRWLQNVAHMPMLLPDDPHIRLFLKQHGQSERQLMEIADRLGINLAVVDDLLAIDAQRMVRPPRKKRSSKAKKRA